MIIKMKFLFFISFMLSLLPACRESALLPVDRYPHNNSYGAGTYRSVDGIYAFLNALADTCPANIALFQLANSSVQGRPIPLIRIQFGSPHLAKKILIVAGTHGDEAIAVEGMLTALEKFVSNSVQMYKNDQNLTFDLVPLHNPDGYAENQRENANGVDLNRDFPFGIQSRELQPETRAMVRLINDQNYSASLYFHSANETKYENLIRCPVEYRGYGPTILTQPLREELIEMGEQIIAGMNQNPGEQAWRMSTGQVDAGGIASDWCVSGSLRSEYHDLVAESCND